MELYKNNLEQEIIEREWENREEKIDDENSIVLSVSAGDTIHLIEEYLVHAHPISRGYNYSSTQYITFRKAKGGVMNKIYKIDRSFPIEMEVWKNEIDKIIIPDKIKDRLTNYIVKRYSTFGFNKAPKYKFYLLSLLCELPNEPHPPVNNAGGWLYTLKDLKESTGQVFTIKKNI